MKRTRRMLYSSMLLLAMSSLSTTASVAEAADNGSGNDQSFTVVIPKDLPDGATNTNTNLSLEEIKSN